MRIGKSGQLSLFILLGVGLLGLVVASGVGYLVFVDQDAQQREHTLSSIPEELNPIRTYMQSCLYSDAKTALIKAGAQGGYIEPLSFGIFGSYQQPTSSDALVAFEGGDVVIPYWYYLDDDNNCREECTFNSWVPPLTGTNRRSVEQQLISYLEREATPCLEDFSFLDNVGFTLESAGEMEFDILFTDEEVSIYLRYPIRVLSGDKELLVEDYLSEIDVPFKRMYDYSTLIATAAVKFHFLERHIIEIMAVHSGFSREKLPPFSGTRFEVVSTLYWLTFEVKEQIQQLLASYIPILQVRNAQNYNRIETTINSASTPAVQRIYDNAVLPLEQEGFDDLDVRFEYLDWPIYFNINSRGAIIRPDSASFSLFPFFGMQDYNNLYDVSFPTRVVMQDNEALAGEGFTFAFALEGNIRNNEIMNEEFNQSLAEPSNYQEEPLFCEQYVRNSGNISFTIIDGATGQGVEDAEIAYHCGALSCVIDVSGEGGEVVEQFPVCNGGTLALTKVGYVSKAIPLNTQAEVDNDLGEIQLEPKRVRKVLVQKVPYIKTGNEWRFSPTQRRDLNQYEKAIITLTQVNTEQSEPHTIIAVINGDGTESELAYPEIVPGIYEGRIDIIANKSLVVEPEERNIGTDTIMIPEEELVITQHISGGLVRTENVGYIEIVKEDLDTSDTVIFDVVGIQIADVRDLKLEDLEKMAKIEELSHDYFNTFKVHYETVGWTR